MKFTVLTFGCRVNQAESSRIEEGLRARGCVPAGADAAELVVVNTCSVTATADQAARQTIRRIARHNPLARLVVTGCYATRRPAETAALPGVALVLSNDQKDHLVDTIASESGWTTAERFAGREGPCGAPSEPGPGGRTALTLRVQTGCEETCSYCIIPSTRGRQRSVPIPQVLAETRRAAAAGFREIVLTGVHLGSYGRDLTPPCSLVDLLTALDGMAEAIVFRVSSLEPMDCVPGIVDLVASSGRFAPHFHLPLQHASDTLLRAMRRPYTGADYRRLVDGIRDRLPHSAIGSDVIAGFPGETEGDFRFLQAFLTASPLTSLHVFPYSDRPGTVAADLPGKVHGAVVRERAGLIRAVGRDLAASFRKSQIGAVRPALTIDDGTLAVTDNYLKVRIPAGLKRNEQVRVRLLDGGEPIRADVVGEVASAAPAPPDRPGVGRTF